MGVKLAVLAVALDIFFPKKKVRNTFNGSNHWKDGKGW